MRQGEGTRTTGTLGPVRPGAQGATLEDVAAAAGVSRATASRVLSGSQKVSPAARAAVEESARTLGYVPNRAARSLVTRRSNMVALVVPEPSTRLFGEPFFASLVRGLGEGLTERGVQLLLFMAQSSCGEGCIARYLAGGHVDGAVLVSLHGDSRLPQELAASGLPVVQAGRPLSGTTPYVDVDNREAAALAVAHLREQGYERIATIAGPLDMAAGVDRLAGYLDAVATGPVAGTTLVEIGDFTYESGARAMATLLSRAPDLDAVFVASDLMALGAMATLRQAERRIPEDVGVVGFDDSVLASSAHPPLSSVQQPTEELGRSLAASLLSLIETGATPPSPVLTAGLSARQSSARARSPALDPMQSGEATAALT